MTGFDGLLAFSTIDGVIVFLYAAGTIFLGLVLRTKTAHHEGVLRRVGKHESDSGGNLDVCVPSEYDFLPVHDG